MDQKYDIVVSEKAEQDLKLILEYLHVEVSSKTSNKIRLSFLEGLASLQSMPSANSLMREFNFLPLNPYRRLIVKKSWKVIYQINEPEKEVFVLRILHVNRSTDFVRTAL